MRARRASVVAFSIIFLAALFAPIIKVTRADTATFDLAGPRVEVKVTRGGKTLPIADVPNLQPNDRIWVHADFPESQSVHYLLVAAFLRGSTNPSPENWFIRIETWNKQTRVEGNVITVPEGAEQCLLFLAPETGGDFDSIRSAVRGKPGVFVRASQDLNQASLDRSRVETYLNAVKETSDWDPAALQQRSQLLARTLNIKLNQDCFNRPAEQQAPCLTQNSDNLVLDDGHSQSVVAALTSGPSTDLMSAVSYTSVAGGGFYSAYVGAIVDLAKIMGSLHTAKYQYIPALALPKEEDLNLKLNNPPSFRNPKSVLVIGLPAVEAAQIPPLRAVNPDQVLCLQKTPMVLPVEGAPLVFSTDIAHDFVLHFTDKLGAAVDLPATADPSSGGFTVDNSHQLPASMSDAEITGTLRGHWGFESFEGPSFHFRLAHPANWMVPAADQGDLIVGRQDTLHLIADTAVCVDKVGVKNAQGRDLAATWKLAKTDQLEIQVPLANETAGPVQLNVKQFGLNDPDTLPLQTYSEAAHLDHLMINAGDQQGVLEGTRLDEVDSVELKGVRFVPAKLSRDNQQDELRLAVANQGPVSALQPEEKLVANVALKDGRVLDLQTTVEPPRPKVTLVSKTVEPPPVLSAVRFANQDELPADGKMSFLVHSEVPDKLPRTEKIEVASADGSFDVVLSMADGNLILQDTQTVLALLDPLKSFGPSAFGPLRFRPVADDGAKGDWQPLANLVRVPDLKEIRCPDSPDKQCELSGANLFLIDSVASDPQFAHTTPVPVGFMNSKINVPRPNGTLLYIKLRDDPSTVDTIILPVLPEE
jgi:hypothetical protein